MNTSNKRKEVNFMSEKKAKRLLQRNEVPEELTWDLTKVFKSDEEFEKEYQAVNYKVQWIKVVKDFYKSLKIS